MARSSSLPPSGRSSASSFVQIGSPGFPSPRPPSAAGSPAGMSPSQGVGMTSPVNVSVPRASTGPPTTGTFAQPSLNPSNRPAINPTVQSPFMYSGFRASSSMKPAYIGHGAQARPVPVRNTVNPPGNLGGGIGRTPFRSNAPRAGGIYNGETWTGGSTVFPIGRPIALNCFRPKDLRERLKIQDNLEAGLPDEMKLDMPSDADTGSYSITRSIGELRLEIERCGLDNPFRVLVSPTDEIYLLENWGGVTVADVKYWCEQLDHTGCEYDSENLRLTAIKIKNSLGSALSSRVASVTEADTPGPVLFKIAVDQVASLSAAKIRKLTTDLQGLSLKNVAAQSVPLVTKKVTELARQIDFSGVGPADLNALIAKVYTSGTDTGFNHHAWGIYNSISTGFDTRPWRKVIEGLVSFYEQQVQLDLYVPALGKKDADQSIHGLLSAKLDRLEKRLNEGGGKGNDAKTISDTKAGPFSDTRKCYKCGAVGHLSKDCPSTKDLDPLHVPPNTKKGDSRERTRNGVAERWCGRCRDGKGLWTTGPSFHLTEDHPKPAGSETVSPAPAPAPVHAAEANLGVINAPFHFGFLGTIVSSATERGVPKRLRRGVYSLGSVLLNVISLILLLAGLSTFLPVVRLWSPAPFGTPFSRTQPPVLSFLPRTRMGNILAIMTTYAVCLIDTIVWCLSGHIAFLQGCARGLAWPPPPPPAPPDRHNGRSRRRRLLAALKLIAALPCIQARSSGCHPRAFVAHKIHCGNWSPSERSTLRDLLQANVEGAESVTSDDGFRSVIDTGCSKIATFDRSDFLEDTFVASSGTYMGGIASGLAILGEGTVRYEVLDTFGRVKVFEGPAVLVAGLPVRLLPPQRLMPTSDAGHYCINGEDGGYFSFSPDGGKVLTPLDPSTGLPLLTVFRHLDRAAERFEQGLYSCVTLENNQNLSPSQKATLRWHYRLGHIAMPVVTWLARRKLLGPMSSRIAGLGDTNCPSCSSCTYSKQVRRPTGSTHTTARPESVGGIQHGKLDPGTEIAVDQFEVTKRGRLFSSGGREKDVDKFCGGTLFVDVATGLTKAYFQVSLGAADTIRSKLEFERFALSCGVHVQGYRTDNGIFTKLEFMKEIESNHQHLTVSGVGAHHQNGVAERGIRTIVTKARSQLLHAQLRWPEQTPSDLWPMAMQHSEHLLNIIPSASLDGFSPEERFCQSLKSTDQLRELHVWGCPAYVLEPTLQDGRKLPKWQPRSRRGQFVGWSPLHSSKVALIRNLTTGRISPQFHIVFDDWFETVHCDSDTATPPEWDVIITNSHFESNLDAVDLESYELADEWLSKEALHARRALATSSAPLSGSVGLSSPDAGHDPRFPSASLPPSSVSRTPMSPAVSRASPPLPDSVQDDPVRRTLSSSFDSASVVPPPPSPSPAPNPPPPGGVRRSQRTRTAPSRLTYDRPGNVATGVTGYLTLLDYVRERASVNDLSAECVTAYWTLLHMHPDSDELESAQAYFTSMAFAAAVKRKTKVTDPDQPNFRDAMSGPHRAEFIKAMALEISQLVEKDTWHAMLRSQVPADTKIIPLTWVFRIKRLPNGDLSKYKARICVRGDLQDDDRETYAPVVKWPTIRTVLAFAVKNKFFTRQIDFVNAFVQASMPAGEDVYVNLPPGIHLEGYDRDSTVLKLRKSLYGMTRSPLLWFQTLRTALTDLGYEQSKHDQCLFINRTRQSIVLVYCDDCLCFSRENQVLGDLIDGLRHRGLILDEQAISDDVYAYLGIEVDLHGDIVELRQMGLIDKILKAVGMDGPSVTSNDVPAKERPLGKELDASPFDEPWNYASVIGMLLYLENTRPDIQFAVNQCARFMQNPRVPHARAVKKICRYLKGTRSKGLCFKATPSDPLKPIRVDCYVDASFTPCWDVEDPADPDASRSRSGWIIKLDDCPIAFASRKQGEAALSTVEAEYLALSMAMRELIWLRRLVQDVATGFNVAYNPTSVVHSTVWEDNQGCIAVANRPDLTACTRHIVTKYHHFKDNIRVDANGDGIEIAFCRSEDMEADIMTKGVKRELFIPLRDRLMGWHYRQDDV